MKSHAEISRKSIILRICIFAFVVYAAIYLVDMQASIASREQERAALQLELEVQRLANKELERQLESGLDENAIERIARDKLDYVYPDEIVFIDISGS